MGHLAENGAVCRLFVLFIDHILARGNRDKRTEEHISIDLATQCRPSWGLLSGRPKDV